MSEVAIRQAASLLLGWPGEPGWSDTVTLVGEVLAPLDDPAAASLVRCCGALRERNPYELAAHYVDTFDRGRRRTLHMTYYTDGDTRNRGGSLTRIRDLYRSCGWEPDPTELPDFLPTMLEFAGRRPDEGGRLLHDHQPGLELLRAALLKYGTPYADVLAAVCATLPPASPQVGRKVLQLARGGPPAESVGLDGFGASAAPGGPGTSGMAGAAAMAGATGASAAADGVVPGMERQGFRR